MIYIRDFLIIFWGTVYAVIWFIFNQDADPLTYGIMELVVLALIGGWIELITETRRIFREELE